jgi:predicted Zn finger-like uncharacterized protein
MADNLITCPNCNGSLRLKQPPVAGTRIRCPKCATTFAPAGEAPEVIEDADDKRRRPTADDDRPARPSRRGDDDDDDDDDTGPDDDGPRRRDTARRKPRRGVPVWVWLLVGGGVLLLVVVVVVVIFAMGGIGGARVNEANFAKLKFGMREDEVRAILGPPTQVVDGGVRQKLIFPGPAGPGPVNAKALFWAVNEDNQLVSDFHNGQLNMIAGKINGRPVMLGPPIGLPRFP